MNIEPLESRIAPAIFVNAMTARYIDVDGDLVTVKFSKPILTAGNVTDVLVTAAVGFVSEQLRTINLNSGLLAISPESVNVTITAKPQDFDPNDGDPRKFGDGQANLGWLRATSIDLGVVSIAGDVGKITCGANTPNVPAVKSLTVRSLGEQGLDTGAPDLASVFAGRVASLVVKGNVRGAFVFGQATIDAITIGGSLIGGSTVDSGALFATAGFGAITIKGNIEGGGGERAGSIDTDGAIKSITLGGSLLGGSADFAGSLSAALGFGAIKIAGDIQGGDVAGTLVVGAIVSDAGIKSVTVGGSVIGGAAKKGGYIVATTDIGLLVIGRDLLGGSNLETGLVFSQNGSIGSVTIGGSLAGTTGTDSAIVEAGKAIGPVKIGHDIRGLPSRTATIFAGTTLGPVTIGGSVVASGNDSAIITSDGAMGLVKIAGDLRGGSFDSAKIDSGGHLAGVIIGGSVIGGTGNDSGRIDSGGNVGTVKIVGNLVGGSGMESGAIQIGQLLGTQKAGAITIGGSVVGGSGPGSGNIFSARGIDAIKIGRDLAGGPGTGSGHIFAGETIKSLAIGGSVLGASASNTGKILSAGSLGSVIIGGDLRGGDSYSSPVQDSGTIFSNRIGSLTIGGSIIAGHVLGAGSLDHSGSVTGGFDIGSITVKGSLVGNGTQKVKIYALGQQTPTAMSDVAIKSLTIGGRVEHTWIFGGVNRNGDAFNGNAQIGTVKVGGDWIASSLGSGVTSNDGIIGNGNDAVLAGFANDDGQGNNTIIAKIASVTIKGQVLGRAGTTETFGFFAEQIGSFKYNGVTVPLLAGAKNDTFGGLGNFRAHAVGPSLSPSTVLKLSPFAVHVFEV